MAYWILKEEPAEYSFDDLERDGTTRWTGVHNALALRHLRAIRAGDRAIFYHTGAERACVGIVRATSSAVADAADPRGSYWVTVAPVRRLRRPIPLAELRQDRSLAGLDLLRLARLSVVPVSRAHWALLLAHERASVAGGAPLTGATPGRARAAGRRRSSSAAPRRR